MGRNQLEFEMICSPHRRIRSPLREYQKSKYICYHLLASADPLMLYALRTLQKSSPTSLIYYHPAIFLLPKMRHTPALTTAFFPLFAWSVNAQTT